MLWCVLIVSGPTLQLFGQIDVHKFELISDSIFEEGIRSGLCPGAALSWTDKDSILFTKAYGYGNLEIEIAADARRTRFQVGSIGKILTALAVLQLVDQGSIDLDENINTYLAGFEVRSPSGQPITTRHLLNHNAGFNDRVIRYACRDSNEIEPLATHLKRRMPSTYIDPGVEISYSNYGYGLAGYIVECVSGMEFSQYVRTYILDPLDMSHSGYSIQPSSRYYARGYRMGPEGFKSVPPMYRHLLPAGSLITTAEDMSHLLQMFLNGGRWKDRSIVSDSLIEQMFQASFRNHPTLPGYTLGFEEQNFNGIRALAKGGQIPGYNAAIVLFPQNGKAVFTAVNASDDQLLQDYFDLLKVKWKPNTQEEKKPFEGQLDLDRFTGDYRSNRYNRNTIERLFALFHSSKVIWKSSDSTLGTYHDGKYQKYQPVDSTVFVNVSEPGRYMVFESDDHGRIRTVHHNTYISGIQIPQTFEKLAWYENNDFLNEQFPVIPLILLTYLLFPVYLLIRFVLSRAIPKRFSMGIIHWMAHLSGSLFALLVLIYILFYFIELLRLGIQLIYGIPSHLQMFHWIPYLMIACLPFMVISILKLWRKQGPSLFFRCYYSLYTLAALIWIWVLQYWNFLGFHY